ncbi:MAG: hypothetical protein IH984_16885 [Planctomycetes bacterium]|nr:hypothetical protein [Planctomycetota bacterium]
MNKAYFLILFFLMLAGGAGTARAQDDVDIKLDQFGVGSFFRQGEITGIRLKLTSSLEDFTQCWVQWDIPNAEGDPAGYGRVVHLTPGIASDVWLYAPLSARVKSNSTWNIRVFEYEDEQSGAEISGTRISPSQVGAQMVQKYTGLIAIVGQAAMKLDDYNNPRAGLGLPPGSHEDTRIVSITRPDRLPDRWEGLKAFEAVVWSDAKPQDLRSISASALLEYVQRGGHLVITLPGSGNPWVLGRGGTYLDQVLPSLAPRKDEGLKLSSILSIISKSKKVLRDIEISTRVFKDINSDFDAIDNHYEPLIALADKRVVVIRRTYGHGHVTLIGLPLASQQLSSMGLPQADVFWNRILGRRYDTIRPVELTAMDKAGKFNRTPGKQVQVGTAKLVEDQLSETASPGVGILASFILFAVYFLLAGPLGFYVLKQRKLTRHSWIVFAAVAGLFTGIAWAGARVLRKNSIEIRHVTVLDHIARPPSDPRPEEPLYQRAISWNNIYNPGYGMTRLSIESDEGQRDLITTWSDPDKAPQPFPNVAPYTIDVGQSPADYEITTRASVTEFQVNWVGALDPKWGGMIRVDPTDPIKVVRNDEGDKDIALTGSLINDLPGQLKDVLIIWITNDRSRPRILAKDAKGEELDWVPMLRSGDTLNIGEMWRFGAWNQDEKIDFSKKEFTPSPSTDFARNVNQEYVQYFVRDNSLTSGSHFGLGHNNRRKFLEMLSMFHHITPPLYHKQGKFGTDKFIVMSRSMGRELDLSTWLSRPCLIIMGQLNDSKTPIPLRVEGEEVNSSGITFVRWIYPLPVEESELSPKNPSDEEE